MPDLFSKVSELLSDPEAAAKIQSIASSLSAGEPSEQVAAEPASLPSDGENGSGLRDASPSLFGGGISGGHRRETDLLSAVRPYLRPSRAGKIDRALKAIRMIDLLSNLR